MKTYKFAVSLCNGWCCGYLEIDADNEDEAYDMVMDYVAEKLNESFPTLGIDYNVECNNPDEEDYDDDEELMEDLQMEQKEQM